MASTQTDFLVSGAGPAGLVAALALSRQGCCVTLVGPRAGADDRRTTAIMRPAFAFLEELGVAEAIARDAAPLRVMRIVDGTSRLVRGPTVTFRAEEIGEACFGYNVPNARLLAALDEAVSAAPGLTRHVGLVRQWVPADDQVAAELDDGSWVTARAAVAADGRHSSARQAAGIRARVRETGQTALVLNFAHGRDHGSVSTEFHTESGPFTQVPLPGRRSSLVWVLRPRDAEHHLALPDAELSLLVEETMRSMLGRVTVEPGRQAYPLAAALPDRFARNRIFLVGEAAHLFPPIGAQGLNLGIRDVQHLAAVAAAHRHDPGARAALAAYDRGRRPDIVARASAVNLLNRSLLSDLLPAQIARAAGLGLLRAAPPLRAFFMREGLRGGAGFAALFAASGK